MDAGRMTGSLRENWLEALVGLAVLLIAGWFVFFAYDRTSGGVSAGRYLLTARFPNANGIAPGTDVRVSGMKVGSVSGITLDGTSFQAIATLAIDDGVRLPRDSTAAITAEGILGGSYVALMPGGAGEPLKAGDEITETQGAVDLMGLVGSVINRSGADAPADRPLAPTTPEAAREAPAPPEMTVEPAVEPAVEPLVR